MDEEEKYYTSLGMRTYGGGFVQALGQALTHADHINAKIIKKAFPDYCNTYLEMGKILHEKQQKPITLLKPTGEEDEWNRPLYKDKAGRYYCDVLLGNTENPEICYKGGKNSEPSHTIINYKIVKD